MQQRQYGALILMSTHFTQGGREPVNIDFYWMFSQHQQTPA